MRFLSRFQKSTAPRTLARKQSNHARPRIEPLEDRIVPATDVWYDDIVTVAGTDPAGNVYAFGRVSETADLDPGPGTAWHSGPDHFLAKYTPDQQLLWEQSAADLFGPAPTGGRQFVRDVKSYSADGNNYLYVMDATQPAQPPAATFWLAKFQDTGSGLTPVWQVEIGRYGNIAIGTDGSIYMALAFSQAVDLDPSDPSDAGDTLDPSAGTAALAKWGPDGTFLWKRQFATGYSDLAVVNRDGADVVYVGGGFSGTAPVEGTSTMLTDQGVTNQPLSGDGYLVSYDADGTFQSLAQFVDAGVIRIAAAPTGTYLSLSHYWDALGYTGQQNNDIIFGRLSATGDGLAWTQHIAGQQDDIVNDLLIQSGSLIMTGEFGGSTISPFAVDFDPGAGVYSFTARGDEDGFVAAYSADDGTLQWAQQFGGDGRTGSTTQDAGGTLAVSGSNLFVGGYFATGTGYFGTDTFHNEAGIDGFLMTVTTTGDYQGAIQVESVIRTLDNGTAGYSETGRGWKNYVNGGLGGDARYHAKGSGANEATWSFSNLPAGTYEVMATWKPNSKNATNATYSFGGVSATVDQRQTPATYVDFGYGSYFQTLGTAIVGPDGKFTVQLSDKANGNVVADAVRVVLKAPASSLVAVTASPADQPVPQLAHSDMAPVLTEAFHRWQAVGVDTSSLSNLAIRITDLGGTTLGMAAGNTIWLDDNAAGWGWFVDPTPGDDSEFTTPGNQGEQDKMDLLTVIMHEMGHVLGYEHQDDGVMQETLSAGTRLTGFSTESMLPLPTAALDQVFAGSNEVVSDSLLVSLLEKLDRRRS